MSSDALLHVPYKSTQSEQGRGLVKRLETLKQRSDFSVIHYSNYGRAERGPGMCAVVRVAGAASASLDFAPSGKAPAVHPFKEIDNDLVMGLVKSYEY